MEKNKRISEEQIEMIMSGVKHLVPNFKDAIEGAASIMVAANTADFSQLLKQYKEVVLENESLKRELSEKNAMLESLKGLLEEIRAEKEKEFFEKQTGKTVN